MMAEACLELFFNGQHSQFEDALAKLRKVSPHYATRVRQEVLDLTEDND